jgi:hypothetical protein
MKRWQGGSSGFDQPRHRPADRRPGKLAPDNAFGIEREGFGNCSGDQRIKRVGR